MGSRGGYNAIYILSFTSPSTSHISMPSCKRNKCAPYPPSSLKKQTTEKDISDQLFVQVHPAFLPSFLPAITVTCSPPCKMQVYSRLELRDHMLHPHQQRARWSDNATTDFCFQPPMIMNHHLTHFDMQRKKCRQQNAINTTRTSIQQTQEIIQAPTS